MGSERTVRDLNILGDCIRIQLDSAATGGAFALVEVVTPPGMGPPPHIHHNEDEGWFVIEGEVDFLLGDRWVRAAPGSGLFGKRGVPHTFRNAGSKPSRLLVTLSPAGFEQFFVEVDRASASGPPTPDVLMAMGKRYGLEFLPPG